MVEMALYLPIRHTATKFSCIYTYKKCIGTFVTLHLYLSLGSINRQPKVVLLRLIYMALTRRQPILFINHTREIVYAT